MKILLTGATGFLGSHLLRALKSDGHDVVIFKRTTSNTYRIQDMILECTCYNSDQDSIDDIFATEKINVVIHCATLYSRKNDAIEQSIESNLVFPIRILEAAIKNGCKYFINTSSFFCKQIPERMNKGKTLFLSNYTLTKHQFCEWGKLTAIEGKINFINLQMEHIYGPDDGDGKFIRWLEKQFSENVPSVDLTDGIQLRDFIYVADAVEAYRNVIKNLEVYQGFYSMEIGTGETMSVRQFVENLKKSSKAQTELRFGALKRKENEIMYSTASKEIIYFPADQ